VKNFLGTVVFWFFFIQIFVWIPAAFYFRKRRGG